MNSVIVLILSITMATAAVGDDDPAQKVNQLFATFDKPGSPGCSTGVIRNGSFVYKKSFGYASLELGVPLRPDSVFYMGSVSKQFTAASIVLAAEQGYLSLDDDVRKYLPELPDYGHRITLRQMLHQTSGFRDLFDLISLRPHYPRLLPHRPQKFLRPERGGSLRTLVFLVFDRMSLREHALVKDTGDKNASAFLAVKYDVLAVFKTM
jgi:CubicO group peptidase (beta-lactamase class C family)